MSSLLNQLHLVAHVVDIYRLFRRSLLYRPVKQQITLRLDADVVAWFRANAPGGRGYQTEINRVLREHAQRAAKRA